MKFSNFLWHLLKVDKNKIPYYNICFRLLRSTFFSKKFITLLWRLRLRNLSIKTESLKLYKTKYFHFKKDIFANLYSNFEGVIISGKNAGTIFEKHVWVLRRIELNICQIWKFSSFRHGKAKMFSCEKFYVQYIYYQVKLTS